MWVLPYCVAMSSETDVPLDTFGVRLAIVEAERKWNHKQAAEKCGFDPETWRSWVRGRQPHGLHQVARQIADATGYSYEWLMLGGPLRSRWFAHIAQRVRHSRLVHIGGSRREGVTWAGIS
jgi:hypothetical protein